MKLFIALIFLLLSVSAFAANQTLLLDAACKITCVVGELAIEVDQNPTHYELQYDHIYIDYTNLNREQLEKRTSMTEIDLLCKRTFNKEAYAEFKDSLNCLYFKH